MSENVIGRCSNGNSTLTISAFDLILLGVVVTLGAGGVKLVRASEQGRRVV